MRMWNRGFIALLVMVFGILGNPMCWATDPPGQSGVIIDSNSIKSDVDIWGQGNTVSYTAHCTTTCTGAHFIRHTTPDDELSPVNCNVPDWQQSVTLTGTPNARATARTIGASCNWDGQTPAWPGQPPAPASFDHGSAVRSFTVISAYDLTVSGATYVGTEAGVPVYVASKSDSPLTLSATTYPSVSLSPRDTTGHPEKDLVSWSAGTATSSQLSQTFSRNTPGIYPVTCFIGNTQRSVIIKVRACDAISISDLTMYSISKTGISISATVTCEGNAAPNLTVTFSCGALSFPGGATAVTNASGVATVTANTGSSPSSALDAETITASVPDGIGNTYEAHDHFTVVKVNSPTPASPSIIVGHYPTDSLYSVLLTYTVSPAISGVPVSFSFQSGQNGVNYAATLENGSSATDSNGQSTVRVRSSDLEQAMTVLGTYQESSGSTGVTFLGLTGCACN